MEDEETPDTTYVVLLDEVLLRNGRYDATQLAAFDDVRSTRLDDPEALRAFADELKDDYQVSGVMGFSEASVLPSALIAEALGLPGIGVEVAQRCRNKARMAEAFNAAGVRCPASFIATTGTDLYQEVSKLGGFPVICKPLMGFASFGVIKANNERELVSALHRIRRGTRFLMRKYHTLDNSYCEDQVLVQRFVPGVEVAVDGFVFEGEARTLAIIDKPHLSEGPYFPDGLHVLPSRLPETTQARIRRAAADSVKAVGLDNSPFHLEARLEGDNVVVLELAARVAFVRCMRLALGIDSMAIMRSLRLGRAPGWEAKWQRFAGNYCVTAERGGVFRGFAGIEVATSDPLVDSVLVHVKEGSRVAPPPESTGDIAHILACGGSYDEVTEVLQRTRASLNAVID
jgi:biotin carboxylase